MVEIEIALSPTTSLDDADRVIETCCEILGLRQTLKGTLAAYPNCIHWHYKQGKQAGTLEITLWREKRRIWFKVSAGRQAEWITAIVGQLEQAVQVALENK